MQVSGSIAGSRKMNADIILQAMSDVQITDVISAETKRSVLGRLTVLKSALDCVALTCQICSARKDCERLVDEILTTT